MIMMPWLCMHNLMYSISASGISESGFREGWKSAVLMIQINHRRDFFFDAVVSPQARSLVKQIEEWSELG